MTEQEWLASNNPQRMLLLRVTTCCGCLWMENGDGTVSLDDGQTPCGHCDNAPILPYTPFSDRKLRLFAVACAAEAIHLMEDKRSVLAVKGAEMFADGLCQESYLNLLNHEASLAREGQTTIMRAAFQREVATWNAKLAAIDVTGEIALQAASLSAEHSQNAISYASYVSAGANPLDVRAEARLNVAARQASLLRCIMGNPFRPYHVRWAGGPIRSVAEAIYKERSFQDLPVLADALEDAGCQDEQILSHLRSPGPHALGCWALDLTLGKL